MKKNILLYLLLLVSIPNYGQQGLNEEINKLFKEELEKQSIKNAFLKVYSKSKAIDINIIESKNNKEILSKNTPFYTASITKMLTATAIGILKDKHLLNFEDKIADYLPETLLNGLHVLDNKEYSNNITIAQLLQHTSGLPDYFTDATNDGSPNIINQLLIDTDKSWSAEELIQFSKEKMKPHFIPGESYYYTDTEYVLLGLIIEKVSRVSLAEFFKQHIFQPLEMNNSYINLKSSPINSTPPIAEFYVDTTELSSIKSLSADWGGGGLVATAEDLIRFFEAYNNHKILEKNTLLTMRNWVFETKGMEYGYGIRKVSFNKIYDNNTDLHIIGHNGSTASFLWYCPELDTYVAGTLNQLEASKSSLNLVYKVLESIKNH